MIDPQICQESQLYAAAEPAFSGPVMLVGGRIEVVYPLTQIVEPTVA